MPYIEALELNATYLSEFSLDKFVHLKILCIYGNIEKDFNYGLFDNLSNQLEELKIACDFSNKRLVKFFYGQTFPFLSKLILYQSSITKIEKEMFDAFPSLLYLTIIKNKQLRIIDPDAFSNLKHHLCYLNLSENRIKSIGKRHFSGLNKLQTIDLSNNRLERLRKDAFLSQVESLECLNLNNNKRLKLDPKLFDYLRNLKPLDMKNFE